MTMHEQPGSQRSKLLLLGATGGTGRHIVNQALARGHRVTAFARTPEKLPEHEGLTAVRGDPRDGAALAVPAAGHDVVISALGPRSRHDEELMPACVESIITACRQANIPRVLLISSALLFPNTGVAGAFFSWLIRGSLRGASRAEQLLMQSGLNWTIVRPVRLTDGPATGTFRVATRALPSAPRPVPRADVARFLVEEMESGERRRALVGLCR